MSAWNRIPVSTFYHLHLVFLHDNGAQDSVMQKKILNEARKISKFVSKYGVLVDVSATHLWDFDVESFVTTASSKEQRFLIQDVEILTTEVDKYVNWMGVGIAQPFIKMAIFVSNDKIKLINANVSSYLSTKIPLLFLRMMIQTDLLLRHGAELAPSIYKIHRQRRLF